MVEFSEIWRAGSPELPGASDPDALAARWEQWHTAGARSPDAPDAVFAASVQDSGQPARLLEAAFGNSPYLSHILIEDIGFTRLLLAEGPIAMMSELLADLMDRSRLGSETRAELMTRMRIAKKRFAAALAMADIAGCRDVMSLASDLSRFACACIESGASQLLREAHDRGKLRLQNPEQPTLASGLILLGMGKLGAGELNYSSDIDIIVLFDEDISEVDFGAHQQVFSRLARNLVEILARRTADGYVFRTDLRLRPDPSSTPPAVSVKAALAYYRNVGQTWERAALIKARPVAGDMKAGRAFLEANSGFIWRRHLDFASVRDIQTIKRQINANKGVGEISVEGHNVKLGRGGIREIEFFTQAQQLIWGGQTEELRGNETLTMLSRLASLGRIRMSAADELSSAYRWLRRIEHRIQMIDDQQTHSLPSSGDGVDRLALFLGHSDAEGFREELLRTLKTVNSHYDQIFERKTSGAKEFELDFGSEDTRERAQDTFAAQGFRQPQLAWETVHGWFTGRTRATKSERAATVMMEITPRLLAEFANAVDPDLTLARFSGFLDRISRSIGLLEMLSVQPVLIELVCEIMSTAPRLSEWLGQDPGLLESVLQNEFADLELPEDLGLEEHVSSSARRGLVQVHYQLEFGRHQLTSELNESIGQFRNDLQSVLDFQRRWARRKIFQIGIHVLRGYLTPAEASTPLCRIAESCLESLLPVITEEFEARHGVVDGGKLAIIACGKLGSREMTVASDLDLIFVYDHDERCQASDGDKPLSPTQYYAKLCRRFLNGVTAPTAEGRLFEVDMRLRPSGKSGPIACSLERFLKYQNEDAWTWEHQALTRARVIYAEGDLGDHLSAEIHRVLCKSRDAGGLAADIRAMRQRIRTESAGGDENTIKHRRGGILDIEFIAQFLQLFHASLHPQILLRDSHSVFIKAGELDLIERSTSEDLAEAIVFWRNLQGLLMLGTEGSHPEIDMDKALGSSLGADSGGVLYSSFMGSLEDTAELVACHFDSLLPGRVQDLP